MSYLRYYENTANSLDMFLTDCCVFDPNASIPVKEFQTSYKAYCDQRNTKLPEIRYTEKIAMCTTTSAFVSEIQKSNNFGTLERYYKTQGLFQKISGTNYEPSPLKQELVPEF